MATSGPDLLVAAYQAFAPDERDEAFDRIHQVRLDEDAGTESDMGRYLRSLRRVADEVGRTPTSDEYREMQPKLVAAGEMSRPSAACTGSSGRGPTPAKHST